MTSRSTASPPSSSPRRKLVTDPRTTPLQLVAVAPGPWWGTVESIAWNLPNRDRFIRRHDTHAEAVSVQRHRNDTRERDSERPTSARTLLVVDRHDGSGWRLADRPGTD